MADRRGPWEPEQDKHRGLPLRFGLWLVLLLGLLGLIALLVAGFPEALDRAGDWSRVAYLTLLVALISGSVVLSRRQRLSGLAKQAALWLAIALALLVGYGYRFELGHVAGRVMGELLPHRGQAVGERTLAFRAGPDGHFRVEARVNGVPLRFLVDTGASAVVLSPRDARRLGFDPDRLDYSRVMLTAGGPVRAAPVRLDSIEIGELKLTAQPALVNPHEMGGDSLLGLAFLDRLKGYEVADGSLILRW